MRPAVAKIYQVVLDAQRAAIDAIRPGAKLADIPHVAVNSSPKANILRRLGYAVLQRPDLRLIVDGRPLSWDQLGTMLMTYEGFDFKLEIMDTTEAA